MRRLISKKFLVTVGTLAWLLIDRQYALATGFAAAYVGVQGALDGFGNTKVAPPVE